MARPSKYDTHAQPIPLNCDEVLAKLHENVKYEFIGGEKEFEENIIEHIDELIQASSLPPKRVIKRQKQFRFENSQIIIDILIQHVDGSVTIIEVKKSNNKNPQTSPSAQVGAIGQLLLYKTIIECTFNQKVRLLLIDNKIHYRTFITVKSNNIPIALMDFQKDFVMISHIPEEWR